MISNGNIQTHRTDKEDDSKNENFTLYSVVNTRNNFKLKNAFRYRLSSYQEHRPDEENDDNYENVSSNGDANDGRKWKYQLVIVGLLCGCGWLQLEFEFIY